MARPTANDVLYTYQRAASDFAKARNTTLFEQPALDRMLRLMRAQDRTDDVLDLGCGTGSPVATYLASCGCEVTGVDGAAAMVARFSAQLPAAKVHHADMRTLKLHQGFQGILAWNSLFHLSPVDQRNIFAVFAAHAAPGAAVMFTSGSAAGEAWGEAAPGYPIYHASLDPDDYRAAFTQHGFTEVAYRPEDPDCAGHTIWLLQYRT